MTDAEFDTQKERVGAFFRKWIALLSLTDWWIINLVYKRDHGEVSANRWETTMLCSSDWRYGKAEITIFLPILTENTDEELEGFVTHELAHILLNETRAQANGNEDWGDHEERVAESLSRAFLSIHKGSVSNG